MTLCVADYSSLEIGIQGDYCLRLFGDDQIVRAYADQAKVELGGKDVDMHSNNARSVFGTWLGWVIPAWVKVDGHQVLCPYAGETVDKIPVGEFKKHPYGGLCRDLIKAIWYGMAYGKGAYGFATLIGADGKMIGEDAAGKMVGALLDAVPGMRKWFAWVEQFVRNHHGIYSLGGRWCDLATEMGGEEWQQRRGCRRAYNFPMQAAGAEIIGDAMVRVGSCPELAALGYLLSLQVHDELMLRGPLVHIARATELLRHHMVSATANGTRLLFKPQVTTGHGANYAVAK